MTDFVEFLHGVKASAINKYPDPRVYAAAPSTAGNEATGSDGGFAVPPDTASEIIAAVRELSLAGRCAQLTTTSNTLTLPVDDRAPWADTHFVWENELSTLTQTKPQFSGRNMRLAKIVGLIPVSDELLEDAPGLDSYMRATIPEKLSAKLNTAIVRGSGAGQLLGILNAGCLISLTRGGSVAASATAMVKRLPGESQQRAVWLANPSVEIPTTPGLPRLLEGLPVLGIESCSASGTKGDLILADMLGYQIAMKSPAPQIATSIHLWFDAAAVAYRVTLRVQGQPLWAAPAAPQFGTDTRSQFVTLENAA